MVLCANDPLLSIRTQAHTFDVQFHPTDQLIVAATITGEIECHKFDLGEGGGVAVPGAASASTPSSSSQCLRTFASHEESCRAARFMPSPGGDKVSEGLASTSADGWAALTNLETGKRTWRAQLESAGAALLPLRDGHRFAVGDDDGRVKVYDVRKKEKTNKPVCEFAENSDFVSDMALGTDGHSLCVTSGDGTLAVYDMRKTGTKGLIAMSDFLEDEYLSCAVLRQGSKVVCGSQTGVIAIFTWGDFGDMKDRIRGHPGSVDAIVSVSEEGIITGSDDGTIRVVSVHSKTLGSTIVGILGEHSEYPIESLSLSSDGGLLASASHNQPAVRLWSTALAHKLLSGSKADDDGEGKDDGDGSDEPDSDDSEAGKKEKPKKKKRRKGKMGAKVDAAQARASNFFGGL